MPVNLNALVRYKTINSCLYGGTRKYDIHELIEACSNALSESRGRYSRISERTIRDDIRVMRSDILGFNAPIVQNAGLYFYSDPGYTILTVRLIDPGIIYPIIKSLLKLHSEIRHPELEIVLERLRLLCPECFEKVYLAESARDLYDSTSAEQHGYLPAMLSMEDARIDHEPGQVHLKSIHMKLQVSWGDLMKAV